MKILHVSHNKLPDGRVEKMAVLDKLLGHKTYFAGPGCESFALERVFDGCYYLPQNMWSWMSLPYFYDRYRSRAKKIIERVNPDIIHVHNILSARAVVDSGYPFVLGDHEFYSMEWRIDKSRQVSWMQKLLSPYQHLLWAKREDVVFVLPEVYIPPSNDTQK